MLINDTIRYYRNAASLMGYSESPLSDAELNALVMKCREYSLEGNLEMKELLSDEISIRMFPIVEKAIDRMRFYRQCDAEDLIQHGMLVLNKSIYSYVPDRGASFRTYLITNLTYALKEYQLRISSAFKLTDRMIKMIPQVAACIRTLGEENSTIKNIAAALDCNDHDLIADAVNLLISGNIYSIDATIDMDDSSVTIGDIIPSDLPSPVDETEETIFWEMLDVLSGFDKQVIISKISACGKCGLSTRELSEEFCVDECIIDASLKKSKKILAKTYKQWHAC